MNIKQLLKKHPALNQSTSLQAICKPLQKLGIVYFSHAHIDEKQQFFCLGTRPEFIELYYKKGYYEFDLHKTSSNQDVRYILWDTIERKSESKALHQDFMSFDQGHTFSICYEHQGKKDIFHFASKLGEASVNEKYLQNLDVLKSFIHYFQDKVAQDKSLSAAYQLGIRLDNQQGGYLTKSQLEADPIHLEQLLTLKRIYIPAYNCYLTNREFACLHWISQGKTFEEVGMVLGITARTVNAHISRCKVKLACRNQFQLGQRYASLTHLLACTML